MKRGLIFDPYMRIGKMPAESTHDSRSTRQTPAASSVIVLASTIRGGAASYWSLRVLFSYLHTDRLIITTSNSLLWLIALLAGRGGTRGSVPPPPPHTCYQP